MNKRKDIQNAAFVYGVKLLQTLLSMELVTAEEYKKIIRISAEYYDTEVVCV